MFEKIHDVFIAYHGTYENNSACEYANRIYNYLKSVGFNCFYFPKEKDDSYKSNVIDVIQARTFILVCNNSIHRLSSGRIDSNNHYELSVELDAFYGAVQTGKDVEIKDAKVVAIGNEWNKGDDEKLHALFSGRTHFYFDYSKKEFEEIRIWVEGRLAEQQSKEEKVGSSDIMKTYIDRSDIVSDINLKEIIKKAEKVYAMGISNSELMRFDYDIFFDSLKNGCDFKLLFLDPNGESTVLREKEEQVKEGRIKKTTLFNLEKLQDIYDEIDDNDRQNLNVYLYDRCPRINLLIIDEVAMLQYYDSFNRGMKNPSFLILDKKGERDLFKYCITKFDEMLAEAKEYDFE